MRAIATAILLCVLLEACGSKGALILPPKPGAEQQQPKPGAEQQQSNSNKQN